MRLTRKSRFAVMAMLDLAMSRDCASVTLAAIERRHGLSISYLEQLFARLRRRGLVVGTRGPRGGYRLARPPQNITIADVVSAVEEAGLPSRHERKRRFDRGRRSEFLWTELSDQLYEFLNGIDLAQLVDRSAPTLDSRRPETCS